MVLWADRNLRLKLMITQWYAKRNHCFLFALLLLVSCDLGGDVSLTNGYRDTIIVTSQSDAKGNIIERCVMLDAGIVFGLDDRHPQYRNLISIRVETVDGIQIAEYSPEYLMKLRRAYNITARQQESWIFTEKGLFLKTEEVQKRYKYNGKDIIDYYRSDEAVNELESRLQ